MCSSLGFHTMTVSCELARTEVERLVKHFCQYRKRTGQIRMLQVLATGPGRRKEYREYEPRYSNGVLLLPTDLHITFCNVDYGIKWRLRANYHYEGFKGYGIEATINPKILGGVHDYITAATYDDMSAAIAKFNLISKNISPMLGIFEMYHFKRIDYCLNFDLEELAPGCTAEQIMNLIRRSNIPVHYKEWTEYDDTAHRKKSCPSSFYLMCHAVNINCYSKYMKFQEQSAENIRKGHPPIPPKTLELARNIIRFEVQCKYPKVYALSQQAGGYNIFNHRKYIDLLDFRACIRQINYHYKSTIGKGDWYNLDMARKAVQSQRFNQQKEDRLLVALQEVNQCRSVAAAIESHQGNDLAAFKRTLKDLADIGINPVTIPRNWGISHIPNLLHTFNDISLVRGTYPEMQLI